MTAVRGPELSPMGEGRERETTCSRCGRGTWNHSAMCWSCIDRERKGDKLDKNELHDAEVAYGWDHYDDPAFVGGDV